MKSLELEIRLVYEAIAGLCADIGRCTVPFVFSDVLFVAEELAWHIDLPALFSIHHVAAVEGLVAQFESLVVSLAIESLLLLGFDRILCLPA